MQSALIVTILSTVIGGLGIFLLGMKYMSDGLQVIAGERLRKIIGVVTTNRFLGIGVGTFVTSIIQSSSVTTVLVVGFVNSKLMTLRQAVGVIMGSNIGTTMTAWILVIAIGKWGLPMLGVAAFVYLFSKKEKLQFSGMAIMGIGMVFFGLEIMKEGFVPLRKLPEFSQWFQVFAADSYFGVLKCAAIGCLLTLIVQSSSATVGITMGLASTGIIHFETAAALVLGENVGTTITAVLASIGTSINARRAAYAHSIFNLLGVLWITAIFAFYLTIIRKIVGHDPNTMVMVDGVTTYPYISAGIATVHSVFNITNTIIFMPFIPLYTKLLEIIVPDKPYIEAPHLTHLDVLMIETPMVAIEQTRKEVLIMAEKNKAMLDDMKKVIDADKPDEALVKSLFAGEEELDTMQTEITAFLTELLASKVPTRISIEAQDQMRIADEYESISDYIVGILKINLRLSKADKVLPDQMKSDLTILHTMVVDYFNMVSTALIQKRESITREAYPQGDAITFKFRDCRSKLMGMLEETRMDPMVSTACMDLLNDYRRLKDHILNIAEEIGHVK